MMCSCSEYEIPREVVQVLSSPITVSWNILQLHRTGNGNALQSNGVVQVTVTDLDNGEHLGEALAWLKTKLPSRSSTASSVTSQRGELKPKLFIQQCLSSYYNEQVLTCSFFMSS